MQADIISGGSPLSFNMMVYPEQHRSTSQYVQERLKDFSARLVGVVDGYANTFYQHAKDLYERVNNSAAINAARASLRQTTAVFHPNSIIPIHDLEGLQAAQPVMQRFLMADPVVRPYYYDQRIDGYSDTYKNLHGKVTGNAHYDYRRVANGIAFSPEEHAINNGRTYTASDDEPGFIYESTYEELLPDDEELKPMQQFDILGAWELQRAFLAKLVDPTNPYGGDVGG